MPDSRIFLCPLEVAIASFPVTALAARRQVEGQGCIKHCHAVEEPGRHDARLCRLRLAMLVTLEPVLAVFGGCTCGRHLSRTFPIP